MENKILKDIQTCTFCPKMCRFTCPVAEATKNESDNPSGKASILYLLQKNKLKFSEEISSLLYRCLMCKSCLENCILKIDVSSFIEYMRTQIPKNLISEEINALKKILDKSNNIYGVIKEGNNISRVANIDSTSNCLLYAGCVSLAKQPEIIDSSIKILNMLNIKFTALEEEICCSSPLIMAGLYSNAKEKIKLLINKLKDKKINKIITLCPECAKTFKSDYKKLGFSFNIEINHISSEIYNHINLLAKKNFNKKIIYYDPCVLSRNLRVIEEPRNILKIFNLNIIELDNTKLKTKCCGMGGLFKLTNMKYSKTILDKLINEINAKDISEVITFCPSCLENFYCYRNSNVNENKKIKFYYLTNYLLSNL